MGAPKLTVTESWPLLAREQAQHLVAEHGSPDVAAGDFLEWHKVGEWQSVRVRRDGLVEETVAYQVPQQRAASMQTFDGQLFVDLYHREVTAVGENEEVNCLRLNLMHDVVTGQKTRGQAWERYEWGQQALHWHWPDPYLTQLQFHTDKRYVRMYSPNETRRRALHPQPPVVYPQPYAH